MGGVTTLPKSDLLSKTIVCLPLTSWRISLSSSESSLEASITQRIISALSAYSLAFCTPIASTWSSVCRKPAVSTKRRDIPSIFIYSSIESRVVPGISVTIALFSRKRAFIKEDLPAFGRPTITAEIPSRMRRPVLAVDKS